MSTITNNKLTDERPDDEGLELLITIRREIAERHASEGRMEQCAVHTLILNALLELQERRKADSDPVGEFYEDGTLNWYQISDGDRVPANRRIPLYRHAQPVPERERIRREHAEWSDATFGDVGPVGPLKHLSKEALEAAEQPGDLSEWADMQLLLWDAQRRAGISDEQITQAMVEKLAVNKQREWPEPKDGEPRLHVKEQPMLVATGATYSRFEDFWSSCKHPFAQDDELKDISWVIWNACRAAMLQSKYRDLSQPVDPQISEYEKIMLQAGNSPVIPDGYTLVPVEPTDEMIVAAMDSDDVTYNESDDTVFYVHHCEIYKAMLAAAPQPEVK
ncbi:TPA: DUF550 domain-containing protein [Salmonella enterica subsp. enterica serovar Muenchen]